jgi:hypothetical protein
MKELTLTHEPTLHRMVFRFALVVGLLFLSAEVATLAKIKSDNTVALITLACIPALGLLSIETVAKRTGERLRALDSLNKGIRAVWATPGDVQESGIAAWLRLYKEYYAATSRPGDVMRHVSPEDVETMTKERQQEFNAALEALWKQDVQMMTKERQREYKALEAWFTSKRFAAQSRMVLDELMAQTVVEILQQRSTAPGALEVLRIFLGRRSGLSQTEIDETLRQIRETQKK